MSSDPSPPAYLAQARNLPKVLYRISLCTPADSLERAELVERLTKLLEGFEPCPECPMPLEPAEGKAPRPCTTPPREDSPHPCIVDARTEMDAHGTRE
jgi:hypothetical protein